MTIAMPVSRSIYTAYVMWRSTQAGTTEMSVDRDDDVVVVARVRLSLADGSSEEWMVPMELTDDALSYHAAVFPPEGAVVVERGPLEAGGRHQAGSGRRAGGHRDPLGSATPIAD